MMYNIKLISFIVFLLMLSGGTYSQAKKGYYTNPILEQGADPWLIQHEGYYYYCAVMPDNSIGVSKSKQLHKINPLKRVWQAPAKGQWNSTNIWAPELHFWQGKWYIYYAAGYEGPPYTHQKTGVLISKTDDPLKGFEDGGMLYTGDELGNWDKNYWAIDMTLLDHKGKLYAVWSGWENDEITDKTQQHLYIAEMENPAKISSARVKISSPELAYEQGSLPLNEGPQILKYSDDDVFIIYSTGQSWLETYKLAYLRLKYPDANPMDPRSWMKGYEPIFEGSDLVYGVGHACFTKSPDGQENYIIYHTKKELSPGWKRDVRMQKFTFDEYGLPQFGKPIPAGEDILLPSGSK